jgi:hypothetical protein
MGGPPIRPSGVDLGSSSRITPFVLVI